MIPELDELARLIPERDRDKRFFWQPYVERMLAQLDGLPAPHGGESLARACLAAGCRAVPVGQRTAVWEPFAPPASDVRGRGIFDLRLRLGLFFAASLRHLMGCAASLRVRVDDAEWVPWGDTTFKAFVEAQGRQPEILWTKGQLFFGDAWLLVDFHLRQHERALLDAALVREVLFFQDLNESAGLFGRMLYDDGQVEVERVDVAAVFLEALARAVKKKALRVNTRVNGHLFVTPAFWLLTTPIGLDCVTGWLRAHPQGPRHDFTRLDVFQALLSQGCLAGVDNSGEGRAARVCIVDSEDWAAPLELKGVPILSDSLPGQSTVPPFDGTIILKEETDDGHDTGEHLRQPHAPGRARTPGRRQAVLPSARTRLGARPVERHGPRQ